MEIKQKTAFEHLHLQSMLVKCRKYSFKLLYILIIIHIRLDVYGTHTVVPYMHDCDTIYNVHSNIYHVSSKTYTTIITITTANRTAFTHTHPTYV